MLDALNIPLTILFFLFCFWTIALIFIYGRASSPARPLRSAGLRWLLRGVFMLFLGFYLYQATWQLAGFARPDFMDFMRKYSRRQVNPAKEMARGSICDRNGVVLAFSENLQRRYPYGRNFCHLLGYADPMFGLAGLEAADNAFLDGLTVASKDELGRFGMNILNRREAEGNRLCLTIDGRLQAAAAALLRERPGAAVALRTSDGSVLALASAPSFDPEKLDPSIFSPAGSVPSPLLNRALQGAYPPGSVIKIMVAACALESGFDGLIDCPPEGYTPPGRYHLPIRDHEYYEHQRRKTEWSGLGRIGLEKGFARSSNVFFAQLGVRLGSRRLNETAARFLFNSRLELFQGSSGIIAARQSAWPVLEPEDRGGMAQQSIGQGALLVTPLHMALVAAAVACGGQPYAPRLAERTQPRLLEPMMTPAASEKLKLLMRHAVEHGTGRGANIKDLNIAGKTGTAQVPDGADHAWFVCFAPADRPAIAVAAIVEHGGYGAASALPVAVGLIKQAKALGLMEPPPEPPAAHESGSRQNGTKAERALQAPLASSPTKEPKP